MNKLTQLFNTKLTQPVGASLEEKETLRACQRDCEMLLTEIEEAVYAESIDLGILDMIRTQLQTIVDDFA